MVKKSTYEIIFSNQAEKDAKKLSKSPLKANALALLDILREDPFRTPPPYEVLRANLDGMYSRRINIQHRLVYAVYEEEKTVKVFRLWTHYE